MTYIIEFIVSMLSSIGFGLVFAIPTKALLVSGINGGLGWIIYKIAFQITGGIYLATFISAFFIAGFSEILAKKLRYPASIFIFPGIINLSPGVYIYRTMSFLISNQNELGMENLYKCFAIAGSIAFGVLLASSFSTSLKTFRNRSSKRTNLIKELK